MVKDRVRVWFELMLGIIVRFRDNVQAKDMVRVYVKVWLALGLGLELVIEFSNSQNYSWLLM